MVVQYSIVRGEGLYDGGVRFGSQAINQPLNLNLFSQIAKANMPRPSNREETLKLLRDSISKGKIIVGAGAGKLSPKALHSNPHSS